MILVAKQPGPWRGVCRAAFGAWSLLLTGQMCQLKPGAALGASVVPEGKSGCRLAPNLWSLRPREPRETSRLALSSRYYLNLFMEMSFYY